MLPKDILMDRNFTVALFSRQLCTVSFFSGWLVLFSHIGVLAQRWEASEASFGELRNLAQKGDFETASPLLEQLLIMSWEDEKAKLAAAQQFHSLGKIYVSWGKTKDAIRIYLAGTPLAAESPVLLAEIKEQHGLLLQQLDQYNAAWKLLYDAWKLREDALPPDDPAIAASLENIASYVMARTERINEEHSLSLKRMSREIETERNPETMMDFSYSMYQRSVQKFLTQALEIHRKTSGEKSLASVRTCVLLARYHMNILNYGPHPNGVDWEALETASREVAHDYLRQAREILEATWGAEHKELLPVLRCEAEWYRDSDDHKKFNEILNLGVKIIENQGATPQDALFFYEERGDLLHFYARETKTIADNMLEEDDSAESTEEYAEMRKLSEDLFRLVARNNQTCLEYALKWTEDYYGGSAAQSQFLFQKQKEAAYHLIDSLWQLGNMEEIYSTVENLRAVGLQRALLLSGNDPLAGLPEEAAQKLYERRLLAERQLKALQVELNLLLEERNMPPEEMARRATKLDQAIITAREEVRHAWNAIQGAGSTSRMLEQASHLSVDYPTFQAHLRETKTIVLEYVLFSTETDISQANPVFKKGTDLYETVSWVNNTMPPSVFLLVYGDGYDEPQLFPLEITPEIADELRQLVPDWNIEAGPLRVSVLDHILQNGKDGILEQFNSQEIPPENNVRLYGLLNLAWHLLLPDQDLRHHLTNDVYERVLVIPDGSLSLLPMEAMVVQDASTDPVFFLDCCPPVVYAPSAGIYQHWMAQSRSQARKSQGTLQNILTLGNPDYSWNYQMEERVQTLPVDSPLLNRTIPQGVLKPLLYTSLESNQIVSACEKYPAKTVVQFLEKEATEENLRRHVEKKQLVHIACHGFVDSSAENLFSALAMTPGDTADPRNDGFLTLAEISELNLTDAELTLFSACETSCGAIQLGEGVWSLGRSALVAGSKRVLTSNWTIDDQSTAFCISTFIANLLEADSQGNVNYAKALLEAKRDVRRQPEWNHPLFWAAYVLWGAS
ncbi:MAG: CHAT domain-containing protein [Planctomycetia bacterium]|nr:CHAT domain-containing protein [Planctomycetia bacterium]